MTEVDYGPSIDLRAVLYHRHFHQISLHFHPLYISMFQTTDMIDGPSLMPLT